MKDIDLEITTQELADYPPCKCGICAGCNWAANHDEDSCDECGLPDDECKCDMGDED